MKLPHYVQTEVVVVYSIIRRTTNAISDFKFYQNVYTPNEVRNEHIPGLLSSDICLVELLLVEIGY